MKENPVKIFIGNIVHCTGKLKIELLENGFVAVLGKDIIAIGNSSELSNEIDKIQRTNDIEKINLEKSQLLIPGFIDTHIHAPQYPNCGLGYDKTLLDWLESYTFKLERRYADLKFAKRIFDALAKTTLKHGTTMACYFATLFTEASTILVDCLVDCGQRAFVGKVNMTKSPFDDYVETEEESIRNTIKFIQNVQARKNNLVKPIITPRFALSTDIPHMTELSNIAKNNNLCIQTHIAENVDEVRLVNETYQMPYAKVYDEAHILTDKTILAHGIYLSDEELQLISQKGSSISHCPQSNYCLKSGLCDVKRLLDHGIKVGLGTDVSGGSSPSILNVMRSALDVSISVSFYKENYQPLTYVDVFYLATLGGAEALSMDDSTGNFVVGKEFDALVVDLNIQDALVDYCQEYTPMEVLQKLIYCGDDRNIIDVFVAGRQVKNKDDHK